MAALPDPTDSLSPEGRRLLDRLEARRGRVDGMYRTMLNHPALTEHVSELGTYLRFGATLPGDVRELVILHTAARLRIGYEWVKHVSPATDAGVAADVIEALRTRREPRGLGDVRRTALTVADCVIDGRSIPADAQDEIVRELGTPAVVELVVLVGFYRMIAGVIVSFDVPLPPGSSDPFAHP